MQKEFSNREIIDILTAIESDSMQDFPNKRTPAKIYFALQYDIQELNKTYTAYQQVVQNLTSKYGVTIPPRDAEDQALKTADPADQEDFNEELVALFQEKTTIDIKTITEEDLEKCGEGRYDALTYNEMLNLQWLVED